MALGRRRGILFSVITLIVLAPILLYILVYLDEIRTQDAQVVLKVRGAELANYIESVSQDVPRILDITARLAFVAALNTIDANGTALDDSSLRLRELMLNRTLYGSNSSFMNSSGLNDWTLAMEQLGTRFGLKTNVTILSLAVNQSDAFTLNFSMTVAVNSTDPLTQIRVDRFYLQSALVSVRNFEDPLYPLKTNGFVKRLVTGGPQPDNVTALDNATALKYYWPSGEGASFLDRMEGRTLLTSKYNVSGVQGLESLVDLQEISSLGVAVDTNSSVADFLYFDPTNHSGCPVIASNYSWMKLDAASAAKYNVTLAPC